MANLKMALPVKLWEPPNFAIVERDVADNKSSISVPLAEIPDDTFHALVEAWVVAIYKKAGKSRPPTKG